MLGYQESQLRYKLLLFDFAQSYFLVNMTISVFLEQETIEANKMQYNEPHIFTEVFSMEPFVPAK